MLVFFSFVWRRMMGEELTWELGLTGGLLSRRDGVGVVRHGY